MPEKQAEIIWRGDVRKGVGEITVPSGVLRQVPVTFAGRFEGAPGTSPEELIAAAHAECYTIALGLALSQHGFQPDQISTRDTVDIEPAGGGFKIMRSHLETQAQIPGLDETTFRTIAREAERACPVSNALRGNVEIVLDAALVPVAAVV